jgi:hypothetical protein
MRTLRNLTVGTLLAAAAVATAAEEGRIETIIVTGNPARSYVSEIEKVAPTTIVEAASPMPTDMPEAEIDLHMLQISIAPASSAKGVKS